MEHWVGGICILVCIVLECFGVSMCVMYMQGFRLQKAKKSRRYII